MKTSARAAVLSGALLFLSTALPSCGTNPRAKESSDDPIRPAARAGEAAVVGTVIDATTGLPLAGARIEGLNAEPVISDERGRFELRGLPIGADGMLVATTEAGWSGKNRIRPLDSGDLEVVIYLRPNR